MHARLRSTVKIQTRRRALDRRPILDAPAKRVQSIPLQRDRKIAQLPRPQSNPPDQGHEGKAEFFLIQVKVIANVPWEFAMVALA